ncbi:hypothetical protein H6A60_09665 [Sutterella massiliensis]|uniref:Uncharacterized protein n=1 Tax=Sutterella massiliensis TaxID=1816689 RepID=A0ABS2DTY0_9BURK|nr:hypothetical protein [Sutterella massiliensis]MBM6704749.1 hypothetical protein [Sutterella massiliensis]
MAAECVVALGMTQHNAQCVREFMRKGSAKMRVLPVLRKRVHGTEIQRCFGFVAICINSDQSRSFAASTVLRQIGVERQVIQVGNADHIACRIENGGIRRNHVDLGRRTIRKAAFKHSAPVGQSGLNGAEFFVGQGSRFIIFRQQLSGFTCIENTELDEGVPIRRIHRNALESLCDFGRKQRYRSERKYCAGKLLASRKPSVL